MKFNIYKAYVEYGGGMSGPSYKILHKDVSLDFVQEFFQDSEVDDRTLETKSDSMGCYTAYRVEVSDLDRRWCTSNSLNKLKGE